MKHNRCIKFLFGASLVEFMIACCLGVIILAGMLTFYLRQSDLFKFHNSFSRIQENGRMADYIFNRQLRSAGYMGCAQLINLRLTPSLPTRRVFGVSQQHSAAMSELPGNLAKHIKAGTDIILINQLIPVISDFKDKISANSYQLTIAKNSILYDGQFYIFSDCTHLERHQLNLLDTPNKVKITPPIITEFAEHAQLNELQQEIYFISDTGRKNMYGNPVYALNRYFVNNSHIPHELIEGIEDMRIFYGLVKHGRLSYYPATRLTADDWQKIKSIRIHLLLASIEPVMLKKGAYTFLGQQIKSNDRLLRREWVTTVALRQSITS